MAPPPQQLMEELVEEILIRFPPDDPASLVHATLVCKLWCRLVCGVTFRRRFREFHRRAVPLLGLLHDDTYYRQVSIYRGDDILRTVELPMDIAYFVPTTSFRPAQASKDHWHVMDARHGRVLLCSGETFYYLCIWDPITDEQLDLPVPPFLNVEVTAVACAATAGGDCDHLDCHRGPLLVIVMSLQYDGMNLSVYSSETGAWSEVTVWEDPTANSDRMYNNLPGILVQSELYILVHFNDYNARTTNHEIVKYNLATQQVSTIRLPSRFRQGKQSILVMTDDDGGLGFAAIVENKLELWSRVAAGVDGDAGFVLTRVIDLPKVLPSGTLMKKEPQLNGFADSGASRVLFVRTCDGLYSIEINSSQVRKMPNCCGNSDIVPYLSFCTPTSRVQN